MANVETLLNDILGSIRDDEWLALESDPCTLPINSFNQSTLLRLRDTQSENSEVDESAVTSLRTQLENYLAEHLPGKPDAQRFIIASCLGLAFVLHEPMHSTDLTSIRLLARNGKTEYYCPLKEPGSLCDYCVCRPLSREEPKPASSEQA